MMAAQEAWSVFAAKSGIKLFAGKGNVDIQAHEGKIGLVADQDVQIVSANNSVEVLAKTSIRLAANGCEILLKDGKITLKMPGNLEIHAAGMKLMGPENVSLSLPSMPQGDTPHDEQFRLLDTETQEPLVNQKYRIELSDGRVFRGVTGADGMTMRVHTGSEAMDMNVVLEF